MVSEFRIAVVVVALMAFSTGASAEERPFSCRGLRHTHLFLIWNETPKSPRIALSSVVFGKYSDGLEYKVLSAESKEIASGDLDAGGFLAEVEGLPPGPRYLVVAEPGLNAVLLATDRPYGMIASLSYPFGASSPGGFLYFYVPPPCKGFKLVACCRSRIEGARIVVRRPDGSTAGALDGELHEETPLNLEVQPPGGGAVWSLEFLPPTTREVSLGYVSFFLEGELPALVASKREWALKIGQEAWRIDEPLRKR